jgi:GNAT superfamily N-acetyltransferase
VRRASEADFTRVFDLVDASRGRKRPREIYEWLYRRNPRGVARCWLVVERKTGRLIGHNARLPWPTHRGADPVDGYVGADNAVAPDWQRKGVMKMLGLVRKSHPWAEQETAIAWPNSRTRGAHQKHNDIITMPDPLAVRSLPLHWRRVSQLPPGLQSAATAAADSLLKAWPELSLRGGAGVRMEEVGRFDSSIDAVAERSEYFSEFWCPRSAAFLNWRYLENPRASYVAYTALEGERPVGYCVVKLAGQRATLMELADASGSAGVARALLLRAIRTARAAGCTAIQCVATPSFRHWPLLRRAGFLRAPSDVYVSIRGEAHPGLRRLQNWQLGPGDIDTL